MVCHLVCSCTKPSRSYTKEFLLSLSELDVCKKLPDGFNESLLSEFRDTSYGGPQDRPRAFGSSPLQGFRRTDYGSSPPARGDSGTYSRGVQRWDSRVEKVRVIQIQLIQSPEGVMEAKEGEPDRTLNMMACLEVVH
ncbi:uncharacterized protein LOC141605421 [Silene latifolia]|uniref:uncharacterized protein LOC141605421 n=1 Tax=Silene latifolia TaxID=37657 RepID=UPI003D770519